jgi:hypothetical protein
MPALALLTAVYIAFIIAHFSWWALLILPLTGLAALLAAISVNWPE